MKLIDKEILLLKIDSKIEEAQKVFNVAPSSVIGGMIEGYTRTKKIISSLEVKEVDLNEEFDKYFFNFVDPDTGEELKRKECWLNIIQAKKFAKHFFELGMVVSKEKDV